MPLYLKTLGKECEFYPVIHSWISNPVSLKISNQRIWKICIFSLDLSLSNFWNYSVPGLRLSSVFKNDIKSTDERRSPHNECFQNNIPLSGRYRLFTLFKIRFIPRAITVQNKIFLWAFYSIAVVWHDRSGIVSGCDIPLLPWGSFVMDKALGGEFKEVKTRDSLSTAEGDVSVCSNWEKGEINADICYCGRRLKVLRYVGRFMKRN
jgi:hypothetical protein